MSAVRLGLMSVSRRECSVASNAAKGTDDPLSLGRCSLFAFLPATQEHCHCGPSSSHAHVAGACLGASPAIGSSGHGVCWRRKLGITRARTS